MPNPATPPTGLALPPHSAGYVPPTPSPPSSGASPSARQSAPAPQAGLSAPAPRTDPLSDLQNRPFHRLTYIRSKQKKPLLRHSCHRSVHYIDEKLGSGWRTGSSRPVIARTCFGYLRKQILGLPDPPAQLPTQ